MCKTIAGKTKPGAIAISLIKAGGRVLVNMQCQIQLVIVLTVAPPGTPTSCLGRWSQGMRVRRDGPQLISTMISKTLGVDCSVLMGANVRAVSMLPGVSAPAPAD
jgi:hypothetical protein